MQTSSTQGTQTRPRLWTFIFIRVGMITAITGVCTQMFMSAFPQYLQQRGFTATQMGLVASGYTICAMVMRIFAGNLIDTKGRRVMCLIGLAMFGFPIFGFYMGPAIAFIVVLRFFQGFGSSLATIATGTMAPDVLPKERMAEGIGYYGLFNSMATAIGPAVGISFLLKGQTDRFFIVGMLLIVAAMGVAFTVNYEKKAKKTSSDGKPELVLSPEEEAFERLAEAEAAEDEKKLFIWKFFDKKAIPAAIISTLITFSTTSITNYVSPFGISIGLSAIGSFFTIQAAFMVVSRLVSGKLAARIGVFKTIVIGLLLDVVAMMLLSTMTNNAMMFAAAAVRGLGGGLYFPLLNVLAVQKAAKSRRGKATSTYYAAYDVGSGIGAPIWGLVADHLGGYRSVYFGAGCLYVISIAAVYILVGRKEK